MPRELETLRKDFPKLKEFANTVGQTIHSDDKADSEDGSESEPESESEQESEPESESEQESEPESETD